MGYRKATILAVGLAVIVLFAVAGSIVVVRLTGEEVIGYEVRKGRYGERTYVWIETGPDGTEVRRPFPRPPNSPRTPYEDRAEAEQLLARGKGELVAVGHFRGARKYYYKVTVSTDIDVILPVSEPVSDADQAAFEAAEDAARRGEGKLGYANERAGVYDYHVDLPDGRSIIFTADRKIESHTDPSGGESPDASEG